MIYNVYIWHIFYILYLSISQNQDIFIHIFPHFYLYLRQDEYSAWIIILYYPVIYHCHWHSKVGRKVRKGFPLIFPLSSSGFVLRNDVSQTDRTQAGGHHCLNTPTETRAKSLNLEWEIQENKHNHQLWRWSTDQLCVWWATIADSEPTLNQHRVVTSSSVW